MAGVSCGAPRRTHSFHAAIRQESGESFALREFPGVRFFAFCLILCPFRMLCRMIPRRTLQSRHRGPDRLRCVSWVKLCGAAAA